MDGWTDSKYVLRQKSVGLPETGYPSLVIGPKGTGSLFSVNDIGLGGDWDLGMDAITQAFLNDIPPQSRTPAIPYNDFYWGWLCGQSSQTDLPGGKKEFRQEFTLGLWARGLYLTWKDANVKPPPKPQVFQGPDPALFPFTKAIPIYRPSDDELLRPANARQ
jgi:hypothetical protein